MRRFTNVSTLAPEEFLRDVGVSLDQFLYIRDQLALLIATERERHPMTRRGKQSSQLTLEDTLLLTLTYVRHDPTFQQLGQQFGVSESSAYNMYDRHRRYLLHLLRLPGKKRLLAPGLEAVILDVTEQPIERPTHRQRAGNCPPDERAHHRALSRVRIAIEHVNRRCNIFRIVKETYRGKHAHVGLTWNLIAGLVNLRHR